MLTIPPATQATNWINYRLRTETLCFYFVLFSSLPRSFSLLNHLRKVLQRCSHSIIFCFFQNVASCSGFSVAMGESGSLCLLKHLTSSWARYQIHVQILNNLSLFCSILLKFLHDEAGLFRNRFYFCWCVVATTRKWYIALKSFFFKRFFFNVWVHRDFVMRDF